MTPDLVGRVRRAGRELRLRSLVVTRADPRGTVTVAGPDPHRAGRRYEIGSVTKLVTGVLLARMVLDGEVALDDPLERHLRWDLPWRDGRAPTLGDLATHRAGLPNTPRPLLVGESALAAGLSSRDPWARIEADRYRALVAREARRIRRPGVFRYSSSGIGLLGAALAARAGTSYEELATERVLRPLGMARSTFDRPAGADAVVRGHSASGAPAPYLRDRMPAAGALASTSEDVTLLIRAGLADSLVPPRLREAVTFSQVPRARVVAGLGVGLAWLLTERDGRVTAWHNGATWGFSAYAAVRPADGVSVVVLTDTCRSVDEFGTELIDAG